MLIIKQKNPVCSIYKGIYIVTVLYIDPVGSFLSLEVSETTKKLDSVLKMCEAAVVKTKNEALGSI